MEKYGEIPPRFTKAWWGYFWEYYRWYVLGTSLALFLLIMTVFQCAHRPKYDATIVYAGHMAYSDTEVQRLTELASEYIPDIDGNGKNSIFFQPLIFSDGAGNEEFDYAIQTKLDLTFVDSDAYIYLMDETEAALYMRRDTIDEMFEPVTSFSDSGDTLAGEKDGVAYALSLKDSKLLRNREIYCDDLYIMVRVNDKTDEKNVISHENALLFAKALAEK